MTLKEKLELLRSDVDVPYDDDCWLDGWHAAIDNVLTLLDAHEETKDERV